MSTFQAQVHTFCDRYELLPRGTTIVVAVSGGPDSLCLLHLLREIAPEYDLRLYVAHLDHQLRPDSADDALFVARIADEWHLPIAIAREDVAAVARELGGGIEAAAREVRLRFLIETAQDVGATAIALGHTADDQAETVVLRLLRGAGPSGLAAMRPKRLADERSGNSSPTLIRPLLHTTRETVLEYCERHSLTPRHDSSNSSPIHLRNRVRGYILPLLKTYNPRIVATLGVSARVCAEEDDLIRDLAERTWDELATGDDRSVAFEREGFEQTHPALQRRLIRRAVKLLNTSVQLEAKHIDLVLDAVAQQRRRLQLPGRLWWERQRSAWRLRIEEATGE
jgi:tRNA(Ile)-lysidine synthase